MAFTKAHLFDPEDQLTCSFARALSHPARLDIIRFLAKSGPCSVESLTRRYPLSNPTVSDHLEKLRKAGLVQFKEKHPYIFYYLDRKNYKKCKAYQMNYFQKIH